MNSWIGKSKEELIKTLGQPTRVVDNGAAGQILVYSPNVGVPAAPPEAPTKTEGEVFRAPSGEQYKPSKMKMFYINPGGTIYAVKMQDV